MYTEILGSQNFRVGSVHLWGKKKKNQLTQRCRELGREEKGEGEDRVDLVERKESPKGREQSSQ